MDLGLANATAVVVGGSRGMGLATARCLAEEGARVAVVGRTRAVLDSAVTDLADRGSPDALGLVADIGDAAQVDKVFTELGQRWSSELNVLINTVGPGAAGSFEDLTDEQWHRIRGRRRDGDGALCAFGTSAAAQGAMGADSQFFGALDTTAKRHAARLHGSQVDADERLEELVLAVGQGRDLGQRGVAGQHRVRVAGRLGKVGWRRRQRPLSP